MAGCWAFLAALCYLGAFVVSTIVESLTVIITTMIGGMVATLLAIIAQRHAGRPGLAVHPAASPPPKPRPPGGTTTSARRPAARKPPRRRVAGTSRKRPKCSTRCRSSTKDVSTCSCSCGGRSHGSEAGGAHRPTRKRKAAAPPRQPGRPGDDDTQVGDVWGPWRRTQ